MGSRESSGRNESTVTIKLLFDLASVEAGELVPSTTLNRFSTPEEEWTLWEKLQLSFKVYFSKID